MKYLEVRRLLATPLSLDSGKPSAAHWKAFCKFLLSKRRSNSVFFSCRMSPAPLAQSQYLILGVQDLGFRGASGFRA